MKSQTLSDYIAATVLSDPSSRQQDINRAKFLLLRQEIDQALRKGYSMLYIYDLLREADEISFTYQAFRRYVNKLIRERDEGKGTCAIAN